MSRRTYWLALVDFVSRGATRTLDEPAGGIVWVVGVGATEAAFKRLVADAPAFEGYSIAEWMELEELEPGYTSAALDGDVIVAELERSRSQLFVDEIQWYAEGADDEDA